MKLILCFLLSFGIASAQIPLVGPVLPKDKPKVSAPKFPVKSPVKSLAPKLIIPSEIIASESYVRFVPDTDAKNVIYIGLSGLDPFPTDELKDSRRFLLPINGVPSGHYKFVAVASSSVGEMTKAHFTVIVGNGKPRPGPGPGPTPPDPPTPPIPKPDTLPFTDPGFRVLIVEESSLRTKLPASQQLVILSKTVRDYLNAKAPMGKGPGDIDWKEWRIYDKEQDVSTDNAAFQRAMRRSRLDKDGQPGKLPWIMISNGKNGYEGPLPESVRETMELLRKYGGD